MSGLGVEAAGIGAITSHEIAGGVERPGRSPAAGGGEGRSFAEVLGQGSGPEGPAAAAGPAAPVEGVSSPVLGAVRDAAVSISRGEHMVERVMRQARHGHVFTQEELLAVQAGVYRYTQELELASKLVDKATGAVRQTLQSQQ